jgi:hypothetical protein
MDTAPDRSPNEAWDLVTRRRGAPTVTVLAALDQARASLRHEPHRDVATRLWWVCRAVSVVERDEDRIDDALRVAARELRRGSSTDETTS